MLSCLSSFDASVACGVQTMNPTACWMPLVDLVVILLGWGCYSMDGIDLDGLDDDLISMQ